MGDAGATIEAHQHRLMRAWIRQDASELKSLVDKSCILHVAADTRVILDRPSWIDAAKGGLRCSAYQMGDFHGRQHGRVVVTSSRCELEMKLCGEPWNGSFWVNDVWKKSRLGRGYRLVERSISRLDSQPKIGAKIRSLQLWR